jgi:hypothetical protein
LYSERKGKILFLEVRPKGKVHFTPGEGGVNLVFRTQNQDADSHLKEYYVTNWLRWILRGAYMECNVTLVLTTNLCNHAIDFGWKKQCYEKSEKRC